MLISNKLEKKMRTVKLFFLKRGFAIGFFSTLVYTAFAAWDPLYFFLGMFSFGWTFVWLGATHHRNPAASLILKRMNGLLLCQEERWKQLEGEYYDVLLEGEVGVLAD